MKKIICILLLVCMTACAAAESVDLAGLSFDQLLELHQKVTAEIISRPEWKEVTVPSGSWTVGKDIPAGSYSVNPGKEGGYIRVSRNGRKIISQGIRTASDAYGKLELLEGDIVEIERGSLIFSRAIGLGF